MQSSKLKSDLTEEREKFKNFESKLQENEKSLKRKVN